MCVVRLCCSLRDDMNVCVGRCCVWFLLLLAICCVLVVCGCLLFVGSCCVMPGACCLLFNVVAFVMCCILVTFNCLVFLLCVV